jgi:hypothetical protein
MAVLSPLFVAGGAGIALLHTTAFDPLLELAAIEPGEVVVVGRVISPPVPTKIGSRADVRVEHLWYEEKEVLRGGGVQVYANDIRVGVGDRVQLNGSLRTPKLRRTASTTANIYKHGESLAWFTLGVCGQQTRSVGGWDGCIAGRTLP